MAQYASLLDRLVVNGDRHPMLLTQDPVHGVGSRKDNGFRRVDVRRVTKVCLETSVMTQ